MMNGLSGTLYVEEKQNFQQINTTQILITWVFLLKYSFLFIHFCKGDIKTMQDFFNYYCFIQRPGSWPIDNKIILFRKGFKPLWEVIPYLITRFLSFVFKRIGKRVDAGF